MIKELRNEDSSSILPALLRMRVLVGYLGERAQFAWWPTDFYQRSSHAFLQPVFPRTMRLAQYHGVSEAARRLHDEYLDRGSFHLFRLPEEIEQDLHRRMLELSGDPMAEPLPSELAMDALNAMAGGSHGEHAGPALMGSIQEIGSPDLIRRVAGAYFAAFSGNTRTYPYMVARS